MCDKLKNAKIDIKTWKNKVESNKDFEFINAYYKTLKNGKNRTWLTIKHKKCGNVFDRDSNIAMNKRNNYKISCPCCGNNFKASYLHAVISEIALKEIDGSELEYDINFRNGKSKYDLFIPSKESKGILIEFQSRYHDGNEYFDEEKKQYALNNGYEYFAFDHRKISVDKVIKIVFGFENYNIDCLEFKHFTNLKCELIKNVQCMVNDFIPKKVISRKLNIAECTINSWIERDIIKIPNNYLKNVLGQTSFVCLTIDGDYIGKYESSSEFYKEKGIRADAKKGKVIIRKGYVIIELEDYYNNNFIIPNTSNSYCKTFYKIDNNNNILKTYNKIKDASDECGYANTNQILAVLNHKLEKAKGNKYIWKYEYENLTQ